VAIGLDGWLHWWRCSNSCPTDRTLIRMQSILTSVNLFWWSLFRPAVLLGTSPVPSGVLKPQKATPSTSEGFSVALQRATGSDGRQLMANAWDTRASGAIASIWPHSPGHRHSPSRAGAFPASVVFDRIPPSPHKASSRSHPPVYRCAAPPPPVPRRMGQ